MASRFWVGGTGTWDGSSTTHWASTSGGTPGASAPTTADTVTFDSLSGTGTCTTASGATCSTVSFNTSTLQLTLGAAFTQTSSFTLTLGTLSLGSNKLTCTQFLTSVSTARTIDFGTGDITLTGSGATIWSGSTVTNLTILGTPVVNCTYSGGTGTRVIGAGSGISESNAISFNVTSGTDSFQISASNVVRNLNFTGFSGTYVSTSATFYGNLTLSSTMTMADGTATRTFAATSGTQVITSNSITFGGSITIDGVSGTTQLADNLTLPSTRTITLTNGTLDLNNKTLSCGLFSNSNSNTRTLAFGSSGVITITGSNGTVWSGSTSTGLTVTGNKTVNLTYSGSVGTRTVNTSTSLPESYAYNFNVSAGTDIVSLQGKYNNLNFTGFTGTVSNNTRTVYGDLTIQSGMTFAGTTAFSKTSGTQTITTNGVTLNTSLTFNGVDSIYQFADAANLGSGTLTFVSGTLSLKAGATTTVNVFTTSGTTGLHYLQSTLVGTRATLSQASGTVSTSYLSIRDIAATGGATWNADRANFNFDAGNNTGWSFGTAPATTKALTMRMGFGL